MMVASVGSVGAVESAAPDDYRLYSGDLLRVQVYDHPDLSVDIRVPNSGAITFPLIGVVEDVLGASADDFVAQVARRLEDGFIRQAVITLAVVEYGPRRIYVMGSVHRPNFVELSPFAPLSAVQAIGQVGGFNDDANREMAQVVREDPARPGSKVSYPVPAADDPNALGRDVVLQPGDLIIVPRLDRVYIIGQVSKPGAVNLPTSEELTVSKAVSLAGGFGKFAREDEVQLLRIGVPPVTVPVRRILAGEAAADADPVLRPGDTVSVPESRF
ncbi:MAG: SLBB domain-containing protein [Planctomycetota bacterium]|jgi:polysaccharide export outer membrane protein